MDSTIYIRISTGETVQKFTRRSANLIDCMIDADNLYLLYGDIEGTYRLFDIENGKELWHKQIGWSDTASLMEIPSTYH